MGSWHSPFAVSMLENVQATTRVRLNDLCHNLPRDAKQLMKCLFKLNPSSRGTAEIALGHDYVADFHDPAKEIVYSHGPIAIGINDNTKLKASEYRQKLYINIDEKKENLRQSRGNGSVDMVPSAVSYDSIDRS